MTRISPECLSQVRKALKAYREEVEATNLTHDTKGTYLRHAESFVRWLDGDFEPGSKV